MYLSPPLLAWWRTPSYPIFPIYHIFILLLQKKEEGVGTKCTHLEIYGIIFVSFCVLPLRVPLENFDVFTFWCFFKTFLQVFSMFDMVFVKVLPHFYNQIKHKIENRFYPPKENNKPMENVQTKGFLYCLEKCQVFP